MPIKIRSEGGILYLFLVVCKPQKTGSVTELLFLFQLEQSLKGDGPDDESPSKGLVQQNIDLRRKLEEEHGNYKRKLQAYQDGQQRQAQLVQKLQAKVFTYQTGSNRVWFGLGWVS